MILDFVPKLQERIRIQKQSAIVQEKWSPLFHSRLLTNSEVKSSAVLMYLETHSGLKYPKMLLCWNRLTSQIKKG